MCLICQIETALPLLNPSLVPYASGVLRLGLMRMSKSMQSIAAAALPVGLKSRPISAFSAINVGKKCIEKKE
jgi:hypothetical protein